MLAPLPEIQWTREKAAHLLNRAAFGGTPQEVDRIYGLGPEAAVRELTEYEGRPPVPVLGDWTAPDPHLLELAAQAKNHKDPLLSRAAKKQLFKQFASQMLQMRQAWLDLMLSGPRPLEEKMTLFWHGHFATSVYKVKVPYFMWRHNEIFRAHATGSWKDLLIAVAKDPAMLIWLDGAESQKGNPNENFAREVMELFTLGEGHYSEDDIKNAARAFVGWTVSRREWSFMDRPLSHDEGEKTFLGHSGPLTGEQVLEILATSPRSAEYLMARLWTYFCNDQPPAPAIADLAEVFTQSGQTFKPVLKVLFRSAQFYAPEVVRHQVKSPVQWLVGTCKCLELPLPAPILGQQLLRQLGQDLFVPPSVKGWDGGTSWISTNTLLSRYNYAGLIVEGQGRVPDSFGKKSNQSHPALALAMERALTPAPVEKLFSAEEMRTPQSLIPALEKRFLQAELPSARRQALHDYLASQKIIDPASVRKAVRLLMDTPEYQLT